MKRYTSFKSLKKAADPRSTPVAVRAPAEGKIRDFLQLVKATIRPNDKPATKAHDGIGE
ncbi:hypothetical protein [Hymenobacter jeollabukensis]|uniref:hypothetical protein n=1 Tax=Hymenobacter jeollabukensis TaxID=2025313 RepID=UPI001484E2C1|nr:hypothetical protein [Hymenobacter jeollabukensis]